MTLGIIVNSMQHSMHGLQYGHTCKFQVATVFLPNVQVFCDVTLTLSEWLRTLRRIAVRSKRREPLTEKTRRHIPEDLNPRMFMPELSSNPQHQLYYYTSVTYSPHVPDINSFTEHFLYIESCKNLARSTGPCIERNPTPC